MEEQWVSIETIQKRLQISRSTAYLYMKRYGIPKEREYHTGKIRYYWPTISALVQVGRPGNPRLAYDTAHQRHAARLRWHPEERAHP